MTGLESSEERANVSFTQSPFIPVPAFAGTGFSGNPARGPGKLYRLADFDKGRARELKYLRLPPHKLDNRIAASNRSLDCVERLHKARDQRVVIGIAQPDPNYGRPFTRCRASYREVLVLCDQDCAAFDGGIPNLLICG